MELKEKELIASLREKEREMEMMRENTDKQIRDIEN